MEEAFQARQEYSSPTRVQSRVPMKIIIQNIKPLDNPGTERETNRPLIVKDHNEIDSSPNKYSLNPSNLAAESLF